MAGSTIYTAVVFRHPIKGLILLVTAAVASVTITSRLYEPWIRVLAHLLHTSMTVNTSHTGLVHRITQALRLWPRVALITSIQVR